MMKKSHIYYNIRQTLKKSFFKQNRFTKKDQNRFVLSHTLYVFVTIFLLERKETKLNSHSPITRYTSKGRSCSKIIALQSETASLIVLLLKVISHSLRIFFKITLIWISHYHNKNKIQ